MDSILIETNQRTIAALKQVAGEWLSVSEADIEKAEPYLFPSLIGYVIDRLQQEKGADSLSEFIQKFDFDGGWAERPLLLIDKCKRMDPKHYPDIVCQSYNYLCQDRKMQLLDKLSEIGDLSKDSLRKTLPVLSTILVSALGQWQKKKQASHEELYTFMISQFEEVARVTPSKLWEEIQSRDSSSDEIEKQSERTAGRAHSFPWFRFVAILSIVLLLLVAFIWVRKPHQSVIESIGLENNSKDTAVKIHHWVLPHQVQISLTEDDPLMPLLHYVQFSKNDSITSFPLSLVTLPDTGLPETYEQTTRHLSRIQEAYPMIRFHISIEILYKPGHSLSSEKMEQMVEKIMQRMSSWVSEDVPTIDMHQKAAPFWQDIPGFTQQLHHQMKWTIYLL